MVSCRFASPQGPQGWHTGPLTSLSPGALIALLVLGVAPVFASACASAPAVDPNAVIGIENSQMSVTVQNRSGLPLTDMDVSIIPVGGQTQFRKFVARLGHQSKADIRLNEFNGRDGTPFNLRVIKPRSIKVTAKDVTGKAYEVEAPWQ